MPRVRNATRVIRLVGLAVVALLLAGVTPAAGAGSLDFAPGAAPSLGDFAPVQLNGSPQLTSAVLTPFSVTDATSSGNGWNLEFKMTQLSGDGHTLPIGSVTMSAPTVAPAAGNAATPPVASGCTGVAALDTTNGCAVALASPGGGDGTWLFSPQPVVLTVPSNAFAAAYTSTFTVALSSGP